MKLTRQDIIERLAEHDTFETKKAATEVLDMLLTTITTTVAAGGEVYLGQSFGGFTAGTQAARSGLNALTGQTYSSPAKQVIKFKPSAGLKEAIAG